MNLYTADLHFGHRSVINFDHRPFADVDEMDNMLICLWNNRVSKDDHVYIIGDFAYRNEKSEEWYLRQLKGHKHLVIGNHDGKLLKNDVAMSYFETVEKMMHVSDNGVQICLCHFPIAEWNGYYRESYHIYGHIHNRTDDAYRFMKKYDRALNAAVSINNYMPVTFQELVMNNQIFKETHA